MKNIQHLIADTDRIRQIFEQWSENQNIPAIERDIVLDKLRHLYEILLSETVIDIAAPAPSQNVCPAPSVTEQEKTEQTAEPAAAAPTPSGLTTEGSVAVSHESTSAPAPNTVSETILGSVSHEEHKEPSEPDTEMEPRLFEEDQMPRPKVDKQVILSLYGDDPHSGQTRFVQSAGRPGSTPLPATSRTDSNGTSDASDGTGPCSRNSSYTYPYGDGVKLRPKKCSGR